MTTKEIIEHILSKDASKIIKAAHQIISLAQDRTSIQEIIPYMEQIIEETKGTDLGGKISPNSRFLAAAYKVLEFHRDSKRCACHLFGIHECINPNKKEKEGYLRISDTSYIDDKWVDYYEAECTSCNQAFKIEEREGHYMWWSWKKIKSYGHIVPHAVSDSPK